MFDFEMSEDKWTERREFLLTEKQAENSSKLNPKEAAILAEMLPADVPFFKVQTAADKSDLLVEAIQNLLYEKVKETKETRKKQSGWQDYSYGDYYSSDSNKWRDYEYLDSD